MPTKRKYKRTKKALYLDDIQILYLHETLDKINHEDRLKEVLRQEILIRLEGERLFRERADLENKEEG